MKIYHILLVFLSIFNCFEYISQDCRISIFHDKIIESVSFKIKSEHAYVVLDNEEVEHLSFGENVRIHKKDTFLIIYLREKKFQVACFKIYSELTNSSLEVSINSNSKIRKYKGDFEVKIEKNKLRIINNISIKNYLQGVLESESGISQNIEYYKVQAIISRTYAIKNKKRHDIDGNFDLCDGVHCQAYYHQGSDIVNINQAIQETSNEVLVNMNNKLFPIFFHSNCGGETAFTENVWNAKVMGYESVLDSFCSGRSNASWTKIIAWKTWEKYLFKYYFLNTFKDFNLEEIKYFEQNKRKVFLFNPKYGIPLTEIRSHFNLKSTFFSVRYENEQIVLTGKGFGHGVGVCQQGAMEMSKSYDCRKILNKYLPHSRIINLEFIQM